MENFAVGAYFATALVAVTGSALVAEQCESSKSTKARPILERLLPAPKDSGFRMEDFFVWGGSLIKVDDTYHLFASRWPKETEFPRGYRDHSEIVRATASNPLGPYEFHEVVLTGRGGEWWDGKMCHNPKIVKSGDTFILYYIGSAVGSGLRKCGYAYSRSINGPWVRADRALPFGRDHNNPAPYIHSDGSVLVAFRDDTLKMYIATAPSFDGTYRIVAENLFPGIRLEDPDLFHLNERYHMVVEDNVAGLTGHDRHGAHLISKDGIQWDIHDPVRVYTHTLPWDDGTVTTVERRERPELFNDNAEQKGNGHPTHLLTAVLSGGNTWCHVQPISPPLIEPDAATDVDRLHR